MKNFEEYKNNSQVRKTTPNINEIKSIREDAIKRFETFYAQKENREMSKFVFENLYEALRELSECISLNEGYKIYSHEITISYLIYRKHLSREEAENFDNFRRTRNKSKYYGENISFEKLEDSLKEFKSLKEKLKYIIKKQIGKLK